MKKSAFVRSVAALLLTGAVITLMRGHYHHDELHREEKTGSVQKVSHAPARKQRATQRSIRTGNATGENPEDAQRAWAEIVGSATNRQHRSAGSHGRSRRNSHSAGRSAIGHGRNVSADSPGSVSNSSMKWLLEGDTITEHKLEIQLDPDRVDAIMHGSLGQDESGQMSEVFSSGEKAPELYDNMNSVLQTVTSSMAVNEGFSERLKNMDLDTLGKLRSGLDERPSWVSTKHVLPQKQPASAVERAAVADEAAAKLRGSINQILMGSTSAAPECKDADPLQQRICAGRPPPTVRRALRRTVCRPPTVHRAALQLLHSADSLLRMQMSSRFARAAIPARAFA
ncbi:hypothetical protein CYMTET_27009 [Cymbomonas tetramitiformis]|uniref:Uncharacterized protein n=1 Tax=Cymbomonas tetramitiformis TaxID=36881 RepID=A0AAE0FQM3_9CHLO|nr:hypothetical protein CYMTET_27009 [Cymbomonas tetramitiformis]